MAIKKKTQRKAILYALFGGFFGLHWFYLGKTMMGLVYIFLFIKMFYVFGIPLVLFLSILNAIGFYNMDPDKFDRKYNKHWLRRERRYRRNNPYEHSSREESPTKKREKKKKKTRRTPQKQRSTTRALKKTLALYNQMDLKGAEEGFIKILEINPTHAEAAYHLACIYSVWEQKEKAFEFLERAVKNGLKQPERIAKEEKLAFLRIQDEYQDFVDMGYRLTIPKSLPPEEDNYLKQLMRLKQLREQGRIKEQIYRNEVEKIKKQYGNSGSDI